MAAAFVSHGVNHLLASVRTLCVHLLGHGDVVIHLGRLRLGRKTLLWQRQENIASCRDQTRLWQR